MLALVGNKMGLRCKSRIRQFCQDAYGGITALTLTVFIVMMVSVGMAVDFMRHETYRAELQDALDRCVLAAAAFNQTIPAKQTCEGYIKSTSFVKSGYKLDVPEPVVTTGSRTITATASYPVDTFFLKLVGIPTLDVHATGTAVEGASKVEVSLVLDISTSMVINETGDANETRLEVLQSSANQFLDLLFTPINNDRLTMSLIPFAGQVNVGSTAFNYLTPSAVHSYSHCIEFESGDFSYVANGPDDVTASPFNTMTQMPAKNSRSQMQHFNFSIYNDAPDGSWSHGPHGISNVDWGWCPTDTQDIEYYATNKDVLKNRVNALRTHEATGTFYGAKWGAMLLDPSSNDLTQALLTASEITNEESELPRSYTDPEVQKYLIIMSDGDTTGQRRVVGDRYDTTAEHEEWAANLSSNQSSDFMYVGPGGNEIYDGPTVTGEYTSDPGEASREAARRAFLDVCETAKDNGVIVFTIGFDLVEGSDAVSDLQACASNAKFFDVSGNQLSKAFSEIASTIQKLRLLN